MVQKNIRTPLLFGWVSPSQTGKVPGPNTDAGRIGLIIHWALKSKKVPTSEARLYGFELDLALEGKVSAEPTDELYFGQTLVWAYRTFRVVFIVDEPRVYRAPSAF